MSRTKAQELRDSLNAVLKEDVLHMASDDKFKVSYLPTGFLPIDLLLQGGLPRGRFTEVYGDYSSLKSAIGYSCIGRTQSTGGTAALIDTEHAFDPDWAATLGVNVDDLIIQRPESGELAIDTAEALIRGGVDMIVFDSVASTLPQQEREKRMHKENIQPARLAALMSAACRRLTAANEQTAVLWINQTRINVGVTFGSNEALPGGRALPYYASYRLNMKKTGKLTRDIKTFNGEKWVPAKEQIGQKFRAVVEKSKLNKPHREMWFDWNLETGMIDLPGFLVAQGVEHGLVKVAGNTWSYGALKAVGRARFIDRVSGDPQALSSLQIAVEQAHGLTPKKRTLKRTIRRRG